MIKGPTNPETKKLIRILKKAGAKEKVALWRDVAERLEKPRRRRIEVNVDSLDKNCKKNDSVVVPGKILAGGEISKAIKVACLSCSVQACEKIKKSGGQCMSISEMIKTNPKGKNIRIMG